MVCSEDFWKNLHVDFLLHYVTCRELLERMLKLPNRKPNEFTNKIVQYITQNELLFWCGSKYTVKKVLSTFPRLNKVFFLLK